MYTIETRNSISPKGLERLSSGLFAIEEEQGVTPPDAILVRSASLHDEKFASSLLAIARAGAGTNNIPIERCTQEGIVVFNTPGANANAVKELVLGALVLSSRNILGGANWAKGLLGQGDDVPKLVEKGKSKFVGPELAGKTLGVIGLGAIGVKVANMAKSLGMNVLGYDPFISIDAAWSLSRGVQHCVNLADIISGADYISVHVPVTKETTGIIGKETLHQMKQGVRIMNFARGELVDEKSMINALKTGRVSSYITDFPTENLLKQAGAVCIPHLGASTPESEENCAVMAADEIKEYLLNGNINNSVNFPEINVPKNGSTRICVINKNAKGILARITAVLDSAEVNIENMTNKSRGEFAYTLVDIEHAPSDEIVANINNIDGVIRIRVI